MIRRPCCQQQETIEKLLLKVKELESKLNDKSRGQEFLSDRVDALMKKCSTQERDLKYLRERVYRLRLMPGRIDEALDWVVRGVSLVQEHLQEQHHAQNDNKSEDEDQYYF